MSEIWTEEKINQLKDCIERKLSSGQTAGTLGITRSAAAGKANRLGLKFLSVVGKKRKIKPATKASPKFLLKGPPIPLPPEPAPYAGFLGIPLNELTDSECHYIEGNPSDALYCGQPAQDGPWCQFHKKLCYHPVMPGKRHTFSLTIGSRSVR